MSKSNVEIIKEIVRAKAKVVDAGVIFDNEKLSNIVDTQDFYDGYDRIVRILCEAIVVYAEYMEDEERNKRARGQLRREERLSQMLACVMDSRWWDA